MLSTKYKNRLIYALPGTYKVTLPGYVKHARCIIIGGGGGGIGCTISNTFSGGGGGAGGFIDGYFRMITGSPITIKVGNGGSSCQDGEDSYIQGVGIAYGGKSNQATSVKNIVKNSSSSFTYVSPGGMGGKTKLYQSAAAICYDGGNGGDGSNATASTTARDGYDYAAVASRGGGGGGGGICKADGGIGRSCIGGTGGGSFGGSAGISYASSSNAIGGGGGGVFFKGGDGIGLIAGTSGGGGGAGLYSSGYQNRGGFGNNYTQTTNAVGAANYGAGGGGSITSGTNRGYAGSGYLTALPNPISQYPIYLLHFYDIFKYINAGFSGQQCDYVTFITDYNYLTPMNALTSGGVGTPGSMTGDAQAYRGCRSTICGGGGGGHGYTSGVSIGGNGATGGGGGGGGGASSNGGSGGAGLVIMDI